MRHAASLLAAMEGISRATFRIARELATNSRSGLTVRFLSKKLELPEEEVEYLIDINHRFLFTDLTKTKIVPEGASAVRRILQGLESHGDVPSLFRHVKSLSSQDIRELEEVAEIEGPCSKNVFAEQFVERYYKQPDSVVSYVATRSFSNAAREVFDLVWQSKEGLMPVSRLRALYAGSEYEVEQGLAELFRGLALFELFRFDAEDRLVRAAGLLSEVRQFRDETQHRSAQRTVLRPCRGPAEPTESYGLDFSHQICRLVAAVAARPARLRCDGELFREDRRRLAEIMPEETEPSLSTCLWVAQGAGWLARVDEELRADGLDALLEMDRLSRHRALCDWLLATERTNCSQRLLAALFEDIRPGQWYRVTDAVAYAVSVHTDDEAPVLRNAGGHWRYISPSASQYAERNIARLFEETLLWLGLVDRAEAEGDSLFRVTKLGAAFLLDRSSDALAQEHEAFLAEIVVQPNFDIVVPSQDVDPLLTVPLDQFAVRASTGQATVYHLSKESFTRAIQEGYDGDRFVAFLLAHNRQGRLPANVMTTLEDWRGGMKHVRLRTLQVIECEDPLVLADLLHRRRLKKHLAPVDPQRVATYAKISKSELARQLERDGFVVD